MKIMKYIQLFCVMLILADIKKIEDNMLSKYKKYQRIYR